MKNWLPVTMNMLLKRLFKTNPFPEFTSRVCPALCEKACINGIDSNATTIHDNENYIIETGFARGWMKPQPPAIRSGKKLRSLEADRRVYPSHNISTKEVIRLRSLKKQIDLEDF